MARKILVADSENWSIQLIASVARGKGHEVVVATNGIEAIERFMNHAPDLVFVDNLLEKVDGFQVARKIKGTELGRVTPIVLMSAIYQQGEEVRRLLDRFGINDFLEKPFSEEAAGALIDSFLADGAEVKVAEPGLEAVQKDAPLKAEGELSLSPISDVLFDLFRNRKTGLLYVTSGEITKVLYLEHGNITFARSNSSRHRLGLLLLQAKRISAEQYERAMQLQTMDKGRTRVGMILVSMGALSEEALRAAVHSQVLAVVFSLFETAAGRYSFHECVKSPEESLPLDVNTLDILMWGVRKMDGVLDFKAYLPAPASRLKRVDGYERLEREVTLTYFERQIFGLVDGRKSVGEIVSVGVLAQIPVYRILYSIFKVGLVEVAQEAADADADQPCVEGKAARESAIPKRGRLISIGTVRLLSKLYFSGRTGVLQIQKDGQIRSLFLKNGRILVARSNLRQDRIGYLLLSSGKVTRQEYDKAIAIRSYSPSSRIGTIFVEMGAISLEDLHWIVKFQILRILRGIFELEDAEYAFIEGGLPTEEMITLEHTTPDLIMDCVRSMPLTTQVRVHQPLMSSLVLKAMDDNQIRRLITVTPSEEKLLAFLGTGKTLSELKSIEFMEAEELERAVFGMLGLGILKTILGSDRNAGVRDAAPDDLVLAASTAEMIDDGLAAEPVADENKDLIGDKIAMMEREIEELRRAKEELQKKLAQSHVDPDKAFGAAPAMPH